MNEKVNKHVSLGASQTDVDTVAQMRETSALRRLEEADKRKSRDQLRNELASKINDAITEILDGTTDTALTRMQGSPYGDIVEQAKATVSWWFVNELGHGNQSKGATKSGVNRATIRKYMAYEENRRNNAK